MKSSIYPKQMIRVGTQAGLLRSYLIHWIFLLLGLFCVHAHANEGITLDKVNNNLCDKASLQRGAALYMNYCSGCHSLQFVRFKEMAKDIGIVDKSGQVLEKVLSQNLNFISDRNTDTIQVAMQKKDAAQWFGVAPPDLSLVARSRGKNWIYTYLRTFYIDEKRPWGMNNLAFPDAAMPNVLQGLQGTQVPAYKTVSLLNEEGNSYEKQEIDRLVLQHPGSLSEAQFNQAITDLVNFLEYVGEPHKLERERLGVWVLLFLVVFVVFTYLLKREYWKDVH